MKGNYIFLTIASLLLGYHLTQQPNFSNFTSSKKIKASKSMHPLLRASIYGDKRSLKKKYKTAFERLGIIHLLTPSGLHLSSLLLIPKLLIPKALPYLLALIFLGLYFSGFSYFSLIRVSLFGLILKTTKLSISTTFIIVFIIDILLGNYIKSPLSFTFSFCFWGLFVYSKSKLNFIKNYLFITLIIAIIMEKEFYICAFVFNSVLTSIFTTIFPLLFTLQWTGILNFLCDFYLSIISLSDNILSYTPHMSSSIFLLPIFFIRKKRFILYVLILPQVIGTTPLRYTAGKYYSEDSGQKCKIKYTGDFYLKKCRRR